MLRVTVELIPFGDENQASVIREVNIWNTGETRENQHRYDYSEESLHQIQNGWLPDERASRADGSVWHDRAWGAEDLASKVLADIAGRW